MASKVKSPSAVAIKRKTPVDTQPSGYIYEFFMVEEFDTFDYFEIHITEKAYFSTLQKAKERLYFIKRIKDAQPKGDTKYKYYIRKYEVDLDKTRDNKEHMFSATIEHLYTPRYGYNDVEEV